MFQWAVIKFLKRVLYGAGRTSGTLANAMYIHVAAHTAPVKTTTCTIMATCAFTSQSEDRSGYTIFSLIITYVRAYCSCFHRGSVVATCHFAKGSTYRVWFGQMFCWGFDSVQQKPMIFGLWPITNIFILTNHNALCVNFYPAAPPGVTTNLKVSM